MSPEQIGLFAVVFIALIGCWLVGRWLFNGNSGPDPWDKETEERIHQPEATPLCSRCLEPQTPEARFCPQCGLPVDPLVSFSPYLYIFAFGDVFRTGTTGKFRVTWVTVLGFILLPLVFIPTLVLPIFLTPFYWFRLVRNLARNQTFSTPTMPTGGGGAS